MTRNVRRLSLGVAFFFTTVASFAQTVFYVHKPLTPGGCVMKYNVMRQDTAYYIIATVTSDRLYFMKESTMMIKTARGEVIKLQGVQVGNICESDAMVMHNNIISTDVEISSTAQFSITPEQFEKIRDGVTKVRLSTVPIEHERTFKKDKLGGRLYKLYAKQRDKYENF